MDICLDGLHGLLSFVPPSFKGSGVITNSSTKSPPPGNARANFERDLAETIVAASRKPPSNANGNEPYKAADETREPTASSGADSPTPFEQDWAKKVTLGQESSLSLSVRDSLSANSSTDFDSMSSAETREPASSSIDSESITSLERDWGEPIFECDHGRNPTVLFQALAAKEWGLVLSILEGREVPDSMKDARSPQLQAKTWIVRKESHGKPGWRILPIHTALMFDAPARIIQGVLEAYPKGARLQDDKGMLPIHMAFKYGRGEDVVNLLAKEYPWGFNVKDSKGRTPIECAATSDKPDRGFVVFMNSIAQDARLEREQRTIKILSKYEATVQKITEEKVKLQVSSAKLKRELSENTKMIRNLQTEIHESKITKEESKKEFAANVEALKKQLVKTGEKVEELDKELKKIEEQERLRKTAYKGVSAESESVVSTTSSKKWFKRRKNRI